MLSIFTPWIMAADTPPRRTAAKLRSKIQRINAEEERPSEQAVQRWGQLKSRYSPVDGNETEPPLRPESTVKRTTLPKGPVNPIPEEAPEELAVDSEAIDETGWLEEEEPLEEPLSSARLLKKAPKALVEEPFPVTTDDDAPAWIYKTDVDAVRTTERLADEEAALPQAEEVPLEPATETDDRPLIPAEPGTEDSTSQEGTSLGEENDDAAYLPQNRSRRPRTIHEIRPTYDLTYDKDIREFAREQARQYNVDRDRGPFPQRMFPGLMYQWEASNFYHYPLYFEDPALERYGHAWPCYLQPAVSIARFSGQLVGLPYQMVIDPPHCPKYALGWYRPGECAPKLHYQVPLNAKAAAVEAGVITGLLFAIP